MCLPVSHPLRICLAEVMSTFRGGRLLAWCHLTLISYEMPSVCLCVSQSLISKRADLYRSRSELRAANSRLVKGLQVLEKRLNPANTKVNVYAFQGSFVERSPTLNRH